MHELTKILKDCRETRESLPWKERDKIITAWLTGRVNHYYNVCDPDYKRKRDTLAKHFELFESPAPERLGETWCGHIRPYMVCGKNPKDEWVVQSLSGTHMGNLWGEPVACPICAAPRPAQKKRLAEILNDGAKPYGFGVCEKQVYQSMAKAALSWFRDLVESQPSVAIDDGSNQCVEAFRTKLLVTLDREAGGGK